MTWQRTACLCIAIVALAGASCADDQPQSTHQAVSPENWSYAALQRVLVDIDVPGLSPTRLSSDFTYIASEMAEMVWSAYEAFMANGEVDQATVRDLCSLLGEYCWELESRSRPVAEALKEMEGRWAEGVNIHGQAATSLVASGQGVRPDITAAASVTLWPNSHRAFGIAEVGYRPSDAQQDRLGRPLVTRAAAYWRRPDYHLTVGRDFLTAGLGARGSYMYGSSADPFEQIRYRDRLQILGTRFVLDMTLAQHEQAGVRAWLLTRRLEKRISPDIEASVTESGTFRVPPPTPYYIVPMDIAQGINNYLVDDPRAMENDNLMIHGDIYWRASSKVHLYAEGAMDEFDFAGFLDAIGVHGLLVNSGLVPELSAPGLHESVYARLYGIYLPNVLGSNRLSLRLESARADRRFGHGIRDESIDYLDDGRPLQHRLGPDANGTYLEAKYFIGDWGLRAYWERSNRRVSVPAPEHENLLGLIAVQQLGHSTSARYGLWYRDTMNAANVLGDRTKTLAASAGVKWAF